MPAWIIVKRKQFYGVDNVQYFIFWWISDDAHNAYSWHSYDIYWIFNDYKIINYT